MDCSDSDSSFGHLDLSLTQGQAPASTSTPKSKGPVGVRRNQTAAVAGPSQAPAKPKPKTHICQKCGKSYSVRAAYRKHYRLHSYENIRNKVPDCAVILNNLIALATCTLTKVQASPSGGGVLECCDYFLSNVGTSFRPFSEKVCQLFLRSVEKQRYFLPSKLLPLLMLVTEDIFADSAVLSELVDLLGNNFSMKTLNFFVCEYVMCFVPVLLKFISSRVHGGELSSSTNACVLDDEDRQSLHYVGGAALEHQMKKAKKYPSDEYWMKVRNIIIPCFNHDVQASDIDKQWTAARSKGGLRCVGDNCMEFLALLAEIIEQTEDSQGNVSYTTVYKKVCQSLSMNLFWDEIISNSVEEKDSLHFRREFVESFCKAYAKGLTKKRMNAFLTRPQASIALRHALAPRQTETQAKEVRATL